MDVGQVSFKDPRKVRPRRIRPTERTSVLTTPPQVKRILVPQRENPIVNRLNKTKVERKPDLQQEREDRLKELRRRDQAAQQLRVSQHAAPGNSIPSLPLTH